MFELRDYQKDLVNRARQSLAQKNRGVLVVSPAGSGKSVVIAEIARLCTVKGGRVMFVVHKRELVKQIAATFQANDVDLRLCTVSTVGKIANRLNKLPKPSLIITDETHHSKAKTYQKIYDFYSDVPRLGFTATPWRLNGDGFEDVYTDLIEGQTVKWLIKNNCLAPFKYFSINVLNEDKLKHASTGDYSNSSINDAFGKTIFGDVVKTWQEKANGQQTIIYAHSIEYSKLVAERFKEAGINAVHCDSKTPDGERNRIMKDFKDGKLKILTNVDLISEGFDVPDCSCVILLRPTESLVLYIQQAMRCMRYKPNKTATIIDHVGNYARFGLPDANREWTLKPRKKRKKNTPTKSNAVPIKQCPECHAVFEGNLMMCPQCGYEFKVAEMKIDEQTKLEEIKSFVPFKVNYILGKKVSELNTYEELQEYAKLKGYKNGWVYYQAKTKKLI